MTEYTDYDSSPVQNNRNLKLEEFITDIEIKAKQLITQWKHSGQDITQISAEGLFVLAEYFQISIIEVIIKKSDDEKSYLAEAIAQNLLTKRTMRGHVEVPRFFSSGKMNPNAYEVASTKVQRNALRKMIPHSLITESIQDNKQTESSHNSSNGNRKDIQNVSSEKETLNSIKNSARAKFSDLVVKRILSDKNISPTEIFSLAEEKAGNSSDWSIAVWTRFKESLDPSKIQSTWIDELLERKKDSESTEESKELKEETIPEMEDVEDSSDEVETESLQSEPSNDNEVKPEKSEEVEASESSKEETQVEETQEETNLEAEETEESEDLSEEEVNAKDRTITYFNSVKSELEDLGISSQKFWRRGVAKRYGVKKSDDLSMNDWNHLYQSLTIEGFADWIKELAEDN